MRFLEGDFQELRIVIGLGFLKFQKHLPGLIFNITHILEITLLYTELMRAKQFGRKNSQAETWKKEISIGIQMLSVSQTQTRFP